MSGFMVNFGLECTCLFVPCHQHIQKGKFLWLRWRVTAVEFIKDELRSECCGTTGWVSSVYLSQSFVHECSIHAVTGSSIILDYEDDFFKGRISITKMLVWQSPRGTTLTWLYLMILICYNKFLYSLTCICMLMWKSKVKWNSLMKPDEESSQKVTKFLPIYYLSQKSLWIPLTLAVGWKISISIDTSVLTVNLVFTFKRWAKVGVVSQVCQSLYGICDIISKL